MFWLQYLLAGLLLAPALAAQCNNTLAPKHDPPVVAEGWHARLVANNFTKPRSLAFDAEGGLLVLDSGRGIQRLTLNDSGGSCLQVVGHTTVVHDTSLNHGLGLSADGKTLFASTPNWLYSWPYDAARGEVTASQPAVLVANMSNSGHITRTLLVASTGDVLVSRGSAGNADPLAREQATGHCQIRLFGPDSNGTEFATGGKLVGWGLRNSVGLAEHPDGGLWSVENSVDNLDRQGADIHNDNPAEELNYHGNITALRGANHGYPVCYTLWGTEGVPGISGLTTGSQFAVDGAEDAAINATESDRSCNADYAGPELAFQAHTAPLDIKFDKNGTTAYISFHGSWNREKPVGYAVGAVSFTNGRPTAPRNSTDAVTNIMSNKDISKCPKGCFRPVGLGWDAKGRLWVASDSTGEVYVLVKGEDKGDDVVHNSAGAQRVSVLALLVGVVLALL